MNKGFAFGVVDSSGSGVVDLFSTTFVSPNLKVGAGAGAVDDMLPNDVEPGDGDDAGGNGEEEVWPKAGVKPLD